MGLTELPIGIPNDTKSLDLSANFLRRIPEDWLLQFHRLIFLNVSRNLISDPFNVPPFLRSLFAQDNQLQDIRPMMETGHRLWRVSFENNKMEVIHKDTFRNCKDLRELVLSSNKLFNIEPGGFTVAEQTTITLNNSPGVKLSPSMFGGRPLKSIEFLDNQLTSIESYTLGGFQYAMRLFSNSLQELPHGLFADNKTESERSVITIDLSKNQIRKVSPSTFKGVKECFLFILAVNKLNDESLPKDLLVNLTVNMLIDLSMNELTKFPSELLRTQDKVVHLYLQRNHITVLDETMFKGLYSLENLYIYQNPIMQMADFQFYETSLIFLFMFQCSLSDVRKRPFATKGNTIKQILMHGNPIKQISNTVWQDLSQDCYVSVDNSLKEAPRTNQTDIIVELVGDYFIRPFEMPYIGNSSFATAGFACTKKSDLEHTCTPCKQGTFGMMYGCVKCPPGGFYQSKTGQYALDGLNCEICNKGTYVSPEAAPGTIATDCEVCPTGTDKSTAAGFRACPCVDNYYRTDRFGECHQCPHEGINCSGEYQHLRPGYWWTWNWTSQENQILLENHDSYMNFVSNIRIKNDSYDRKAQRFRGKLPQVHKCSRDDVCPNGEIGIDSTCSEGYKGWLCSECANKYYSWLGHCLNCPDWPLFAVEVFCIFVVVCIIVGFFVWDAYRRHRRNERNILSIFLARGKIIVGFCQVMGEIFSALDDIPWPTNLQTLGSFFKTMEVSLVSWLISPRCFIPDFTYPNIYIEFLLGFIFIIAVVVSAFCYYVFRKRLLTTAQGLSSRFRDDLSKSKQRCFLIVVILLFLSYPSVCSVIISLLPTGCKLFFLDEDKELNITLLRYDYAIDCEGRDHSFYNYAAQTAMVYVVGFPLVLFILLWCSKTKVSGDEDQASVSSQNSSLVLPDVAQGTTVDTNGLVTESEGTFIHLSSDTAEPDTNISWKSFLCENYKAEFWYWEIIELTRKILQTLFILLFGPEDHFTLFVSVFLSVFFLLIHAYLKPMKDAIEQRLQLCSLGIIFINMLAASLLLMPNDDGPIVDDRKGVLSTALVLLNLSIIVFVAISSVFTGIKTLSRHGCFACIRNSSVHMYRWCRRRYTREPDDYLDDEHSSMFDEQDEQTNEDQDATSVVPVTETLLLA
ncbi:uncharacterized protein [Asterias amurensis]